MHQVRVFIFLVVVAVIPAAFSAVPINTIIAVVNNEPITQLEIQNELQRLQQADRDESAQNDLRQKALDELIDRRLQLQLANRLNIAISDAQLEQRLAEIRQEFNLSSDKALEGAVEEIFFMPYDKFRERVREDMQIRALFYREVYLRTETYEDEIDQFLKLEAGVADEREYHIRHILLTVAADGEDLDEKHELGLSLRAQAVAGSDFAELARRYSDGKKANVGGNLGYKTEKELPDAFIAEVQNLTPDGISDLIATSRGFHLIKLEEARGGDLRETLKQYRLSHIFFESDDGDLAEEVWSGIKNADDFVWAVQQYSVDKTSAERDGEIGWFEESDVPPYFNEAVRNMQAGDISRPVQSAFGWHILYLSDIKDEKFNVQRLREQARLVLLERRALAQRDVWLRRLRGDAHVRILSPDFEYTNR